VCVSTPTLLPAPCITCAARPPPYRSPPCPPSRFRTSAVPTLRRMPKARAHYTRGRERGGWGCTSVMVRRLPDAVSREEEPDEDNTAAAMAGTTRLATSLIRSPGLRDLSSCENPVVPKRC
jgi:hypothetical protein